MHQIEPYYGWIKYYDSSEDECSPFFGKVYNYDLYSETIYGYYVDPGWDFFGSETLCLKILYCDYEAGFCVMEFLGEWNDAIGNDIMYLKREVIETLQRFGITRFILIGENVLNFHGSDDCYYEEWYDEIDEPDQLGDFGWIALVNFREHVLEELKKYNIDSFLHWGESFQIHNWRTLTPKALCSKVNQMIRKRIDLV